MDKIFIGIIALMVFGILAVAGMFIANEFTIYEFTTLDGETRTGRACYSSYGQIRVTDIDGTVYQAQSCKKK